MLRLITRLLVCSLLLILLVPGSGMAQAASISIIHADGEKQDGIYRVNAAINYQISDEASDALAHGIPLEFVIELKLKRHRAWLWDETIISDAISYIVEYQPLSNQFLVRDAVDGSRHQFQRQEDMLEFIGELQDYPLLSMDKLLPGNRYSAQMKTYLNIQSLPAPLRPLAYFSSQWRLTSPVQIWQVLP